MYVILNLKRALNGALGLLLKEKHGIPQINRRSMESCSSDVPTDVPSIARISNKLFIKQSGKKNSSTNLVTGQPTRPSAFKNQILTNITL